MSDPDKPANDASSNAQISRRIAIKRTAGATIIMSSFSSGSALASISCKKFSNWMSGSGSPRLIDEEECALGRSPGFWKNVRENATTCSPAFNNNFGSSLCVGVLGILNSQFSSVFDGGVGSFQEVLDGPGSYIGRAFAAAYLNSMYIPGYPLTTFDVTELWEKVGSLGFLADDIKDYLESTYEAESLNED